LQKSPEDTLPDLAQKTKKGNRAGPIRQGEKKEQRKKTDKKGVGAEKASEIKDVRNSNKKGKNLQRLQNVCETWR